MSEKRDELEEDDIPEMDFSGGVRGKYYERYMKGPNVVFVGQASANVSLKPPAADSRAEHGTDACAPEPEDK